MGPHGFMTRGAFIGPRVLGTHTGAPSTMTDNNDDYQATDYLAICRLSYGYGSHEDAAVMNALRYAGPFEDDEEPIEVAVWKMDAASWKSHNMSGPTEGEQLGFARYMIDPEQADNASQLATEANVALDRALESADTEQAEGDLS